MFADGKVRTEFGVKRYDVPKGDNLMIGIAVASIIAKDFRDRLVVQKYGEEFEEYGVKTNKGYKSPQHLDALRRLGPTKYHRIWMPIVKRTLERSCP